MGNKYKFNPHSAITEQFRAKSSVISLANKEKLSLYKKSRQSGYAIDILEEVYRRGFDSWDEKFDNTPQQYAFDRVNSFVSGGLAAGLDSDLLEKETYTGTEKVSKNKNDASSRFIGTDSLVNVYKNDTPGQSNATICTIKKTVKEAFGNKNFSFKPKSDH
jgi:hypothetical protein